MNIKARLVELSVGEFNELNDAQGDLGAPMIIVDKGIPPRAPNDWTFYADAEELRAWREGCTTTSKASTDNPEAKP